MVCKPPVSAIESAVAEQPNVSVRNLEVCDGFFFFLFREVGGGGGAGEGPTISFVPRSVLT